MSAAITAESDGIILANQDNFLTDKNTTLEAVVNNGFLLSFVIFHADSPLTENVNLAFGYEGAGEYFVPFSAGINTSQLNTNDIVYHVSGKSLSVLGNNNLVLLSDSDVTEGQVTVYMEGYYYAKV